jgi:hypothetical protein
MADVYTIFWVLGFPQGLYMIMFVASVCDVFVVLNMMCFHIHAKVPRYNQAQAHSSSPQVHAVIDRFRNHCPSSFHYAKLSIEIRALQGRNLSRAAASSTTPSQHRSTLGSPQLVGVTKALHMMCQSAKRKSKHAIATYLPGLHHVEVCEGSIGHVETLVGRR